MPTSDLILAPPVGLIHSQSIVFIAPGTLVDESGLASVQGRVEKLARGIDALRNEGLSRLVVSENLPFSIDARLANLYDVSRRVDVLPRNFSALLENVGLPSLVGPDRTIPRTTAAVVYLDPDVPRGTAETHIYRGGEIVGNGRSTITVIRVNADTPFGNHDEALPGIVDGLFTAGEVRARRYNDQVEALAVRLEGALDARYRIDPDDVTLPDFESSNQTDRIGFDQVLRDVAIAREDGSTLPSKSILLETSTVELGRPVFQVIWRRGQLALQIGPLTSEEYASPEFYIARDLFFRIIREAAPGASLSDLLGDYNTELGRELGSAASRYRLGAAEGADIGTIVLRTGNRHAASADITPSVMLPYKDIDSQAFRESLATQTMRDAYDTATRVGHQMFGEFRRYIASHFGSRLPIFFSEEMRAYFVHVLFNEFQLAAVGDNLTRSRLDVLFHASPSDAVFSVLSFEEANVLAIWFNKPGVQHGIAQLMRDQGLTVTSESPIWVRLREAFFVAPRERVESEHAQLWIDPERRWNASPVPDGDGRLVYHYTPGSRDRRPFVVRDDVYHLEVSYTAGSGTLSHLWEGLSEVTPNEATRLLQTLVPDTTIADAYARSVREMEHAARPILSYDVAAEGPEGLSRLIEDFIAQIPESPAALDALGRVGQENAGWWLLARHIGRQVRARAREINENGLAGELAESIRAGFQQNIEGRGPRVNQVSFENGRFHTWRGEVSVEELGLPEGWRPGDAIAGFHVGNPSYNLFEYEWVGENAVLPERFTITWNGLAWPTSHQQAAQNMRPVTTSSVTFTDDRGDQPVERQIDLPGYVRRLPGENQHKFLFRMGGLDGIVVLLDAYDFVPVPEDGETAVRALELMRREILAFHRTRVGHESLDGVAELPRVGASQIDPDARFNGISYSELLGSREVSGIIEIHQDNYRVHLLTPQGARRVILNQGDTAGDLTRDLITLGYNLENLRPDDGEDVQETRMRRLYELDNEVNAELGVPLHFRWRESGTNPIVPLDGSVLLWDENDVPIPVIRAWEETLVNRYIEAFMERARQVVPTLDDLRVGDRYLDLTVGLHMRRILEAIGTDTSRRQLVLELQMLKRQIIEGAGRIRQIRESVPLDGSIDITPLEPFRQIPEGPLPSEDEILETARVGWEAWNRRRYRALGSRELTDAAKAFLTQEVALVGAGAREFTEMGLLYRDLSEVQQNYFLSSLVILLDRALKDNEIIVESASRFLSLHFSELKRIQNEIRLARIDERNRETLRRGILAPEVIWAQVRDARLLVIPEDGMLVHFYEGVQVDERGGPVLPGSEESLSNADLSRVTSEFGADYTGRLIVTPAEVQAVAPGLTLEPPWGLTSPAEAPQRVVEQFQSAAPPEDDAAPPLSPALQEVVDGIVEEGEYDIVGRYLLDPQNRDTHARQSIAVIDESEAVHVEERVAERTGFDPDVAVPLDIRIVNLGEDLSRLHDIRTAGINARIEEYETTTGTLVTLDPDTIRVAGDTVRFSVVRTTALDADGSIPEGEARIALEKTIAGLADDTARVSSTYTALLAENGDAARQAWASFVGSRRKESATTFDPEKGLVPAETPDPVPTLEKARGAAEARTLVVDATAALVEMLRENGLTPDWVPAFETLAKTASGYEIRFFNKENPEETRLIATNDDRIARLKTFMDEHLEKESAAFKEKTAEGEVDGDAPDGLNSAFIIQFLVGLARDAQARQAAPSASGVLATALEVHRWVFVSQVAFGGVMDTIKIGSIIKSLLKSGDETLAVASKTSQALSYAGEAVGAAFMAANLILDSIQLAHADNDVQRAVFGTQIAFDSIGVVLSGAGIGTTVTGSVAGSLASSAVAAGDAAAAATAGSVATVAGTVGSIVGGVGVIVAGLGIGAAALAQNYSVIADEAEKIGKYFQNLDDAYKKGGLLYVTDDGAPRLSALSGAVITDLDFRSDTVTFGSQYISQTTHGSTGSGKQDYFFWIGDFPEENTNAELTIRSELGYADSAAIENADTDLIVLPATPEVHFSGLEWQTLPGATGKNSAGFDVLRKLEDNYLFDYDFYIFPSEYILHKFDTIDYRVTDVDIRLDAADRTLVMPDIPSDQLYKLHYNFYGNGGTYTIGANEGSVSYIRTDGSTPSTWVIDATNLDSDSLTFAGGAISVGGYQLHPYATSDTYLVVNRERDLYSVDVAARTFSILTVDALGHGTNLLAFLGRQRFPGRFLEVTNYRVNGLDVGKAWYDKQDRVIRYVDINNVAFTQNLEILDMVGNQIFFSAAVDGKLEIWKVDATTRRVTHRYGMVAGGDSATQRISGIWKLGTDTVFEQKQTTSSTTITRRYRLSGDSFTLSSIHGDTTLLAAWQRLDAVSSDWTATTLPAQSTALSWQGQTRNESIPVPSTGGTGPGTGLGVAGPPPIYTPTHFITQTVSYSGTFVPAASDAWLSVIGENGRLWVHRDTREVVLAGMHHIPEDLIVIGVDNSQSPKVALFYSAKEQKVYRQEGNRFTAADDRLERVKNGNFGAESHWRFDGDTRTNENKAWLVNGEIAQTIDGLHKGTHYRLRFSAGGQTGTTATSVLVILWNGNEVGRMNWSPSMTDREILLVADRSENRLSFKVEGEATAPPFLLDDVSLKSRPVIEYDGIQNLFTIGPNPVFETLTGEIRRLENSGDTQLTGVTKKWLDAHSDRNVVTVPDDQVLSDQTSHASSPTCRTHGPSRDHGSPQLADRSQKTGGGRRARQRAGDRHPGDRDGSRRHRGRLVRRGWRPLRLRAGPDFGKSPLPRTHGGQDGRHPLQRRHKPAAFGRPHCRRHPLNEIRKRPHPRIRRAPSIAPGSFCRLRSHLRKRGPL